MPKYRVNANILNLNVGDEFESDHPYYVPLKNQGYLTDMTGTEPEMALPDYVQPPAVAVPTPEVSASTQKRSAARKSSGGTRARRNAEGA